eukprot:TRINITY_DN31008_c0_g1_i1.p1 TRINITY_DN31008_c0_g1~~TRINITY_DN31008_c0_g1_i1.p1  ORF type:complete len:198 (-),score=49.57 TRINITY_DN31008_c0_g1_i1:23-616(-)
MKQIGRAAFTTPSVSRRNSTTDTDSKKSMSPFSRRMSRDDRFGSKNSVTSSASFGCNLLSVTSLETYLNSHSEDSDDDTCDTLTINVPVKNSFENGSGQVQGNRLWENVRQRLSRQKKEDDHTQPDSTPKLILTEEKKNAFLGEQFQEMTYEEIAVWLDTRARVIFPLCFLVFNLLYWTLVADNDIFDFIVGEEHEQ